MDPGPTRIKTIGFWAVLIILVLTCLEVVSLVLCRKILPARVINRTAFRTAQDYIVAHRTARTRGIAQPRAAVTSEAPQQQAGLKMFHPVIGWDYPPGVEYLDTAEVRYQHGPKGERRACASFDKDFAATYGNSFTYCSDVEDCQTWQTYLADRIGANVLNFGVAGYGTDQAYLKYELNAAAAVTPVVMLGILPDNINRIVNIFRTFYAPEDLLALTKPRFTRTSEGFALFPNPITRVDDVVKLEDPAFVAKLGEKDYWYQKDINQPAFGFPYILSLIRWRGTLEEYLVFNLGLGRPGPGRRFYPNNLFEEDEPLAIMCYIVDRFVQTARARGSAPVIILMPHRELIEETSKHGMSRIAPLARYLDSKQYRFLDLITVMADMGPSADQRARWYREHATPEGNKVIADIIAAYLEQQGLVPSKFGM